MQPSKMMWLFAFMLLCGGCAAYLLAPEGANAVTALAVPGGAATVMVLIGLLAQIGKGKPLGRAARWIGAVLALVIAGGIGMRGFKSAQGVAKYPQALVEYDVARLTDSELMDGDKKKAFFKERGAPDHDQSYLRNILITLAGCGLVTFLVLAVGNKAKATSGTQDPAGTNPPGEPGRPLPPNS